MEMNLLFNQPTNLLAKLAVLLILLPAAPQVFSAGDYVWESKFAEELPKAKKGNIKSQYAIAEMYEKGKGTEPNAKEALKWYQEAAKKGGKKSTCKNST